MASIDITEAMVFTGLGQFLTDILPPTVDVAQGQVNRVSEIPLPPDFVIMTPGSRQRLGTNARDYRDTFFVGAIADEVLTVDSVAYGELAAGRVLFGIGVAANTTIGDQIDGTPGGAGTYAVSPSQTVDAESMACGVSDATQPTMVIVQLDVHGPASADNTQIITTLWRDPYACDFFKDNGFPLSPLYGDEGQQMPFVNGELQFENRFIIRLHLEINPTVSTPLQFADTLAVDLVEVDTVYPPT